MIAQSIPHARCDRTAPPCAHDAPGGLTPPERPCLCLAGLTFLEPSEQDVGLVAEQVLERVCAEEAVRFVGGDSPGQLHDSREVSIRILRDARCKRTNVLRSAGGVLGAADRQRAASFAKEVRPTCTN